MNSGISSIRISNDSEGIRTRKNYFMVGVTRIYMEEQ